MVKNKNSIDFKCNFFIVLIANILMAPLLKDKNCQSINKNSTENCTTKFNPYLKVNRKILVKFNDILSVVKFLNFWDVELSLFPLFTY